MDWSAICDEALGDFTTSALPPTLSLPALPHAVTLYLEKVKDPDVGAKELAGIIETDSGLTLELLKHVNSAFMGVRNKTGNVQQALSLLGQRQSKSFIVTTGMQAAVRAKKSKLINQANFWNASFQKALFAKEVARLLKTDTEVAFAGALLQDYLLPVITNDLFQQYLGFIETRESQPVCLCEFENATFGWEHSLAAACLARRWQLPDELVCCILFHHHGLKILAHPELGRSPVAAVALSALLPDQLRQHLQGLELLTKLGEKWGAFDVAEIAQKVDEQHDELGLGMRNDFPLSRRCQQASATETPDYNDGTLALAVA